MAIFKWLFLNTYVHKLFTIAQVLSLVIFVASFTHERKSERIERKSKTQNPIPKSQLEHDTMKAKLMALEKKIIVGGENLLEKAEEQERLLDENAKELEETIKEEEELRKALEEKEAEKLDIEEKYVNLQDEAAGKSRKLKKVWTMLQSAKSELSDLQVRF